MTVQPLDPAAIMAEHTDWHRCGPHGKDVAGQTCDPYRLAEALAAERERVQTLADRVRVLETAQNAVMDFSGWHRP